MPLPPPVALLRALFGTLTSPPSEGIGEGWKVDWPGQLSLNHNRPAQVPHYCLIRVSISRSFYSLSCKRDPEILLSDSAEDPSLSVKRFQKEAMS